MFRTSCGGAYGFVSSHAANVFSLAMFLTLRYRKSLTHSLRLNHNATPSHPSRHLFPILIFLWATLVGYSRPYLGKHYPGDVLGGAILGILIGVCVFFVVQLIDNLIRNCSRQKKVA